MLFWVSKPDSIFSVYHSSPSSHVRSSLIGWSFILGNTDCNIVPTCGCRTIRVRKYLQLGTVQGDCEKFSSLFVWLTFMMQVVTVSAVGYVHGLWSGALQATSCQHWLVSIHVLFISNVLPLTGYQTTEKWRLNLCNFCYSAISPFVYNNKTGYRGRNSSQTWTLLFFVCWLNFRLQNVYIIWKF